MAEVLASWVVEMSLAGQQAVEAGAARARAELDGLDQAHRAAADATAAAGRRAQAQAKAAKDALDAQWAATQRSTSAKLAAADKNPSGLDAAAKASLDAMTASVKRFQEAQRTFLADQLAGQRAVAAGYQMLTGTVLSYVRAGMQGTSEGELMQLRMQQLSREVANVFQPVIHRVIDTLERAVTWFRGLNREQQENIARWVMMAGAALFAAQQLPKVAAGFELVGAAMKAAMASNPIGLIIVAAAAMIGLLASTEKGQAALGKLGDTVKNLLGPALEMMAESLGMIADSLADAAEGIGNAADELARARGSNRNEQAEAAQGVNRYATAFHPTNIFLRTVANPLDPWGQWMGAIEQAEQGPRPRRTRDRQELAPRGGGTEDIRSTFSRLQAAANRTDIPQRQLTALEAIRENTAVQTVTRMFGSLFGRNNAPAVGP